MKEWDSKQLESECRSCYSSGECRYHQRFPFLATSTLSLPDLLLHSNVLYTSTWTALHHTFYDFSPTTVITPSPLTASKLPALLPHSTPTAGTAILNGSLHSFSALLYCCTVQPAGPPVSKNCPVQSQARQSTLPPVSRLLICADLRRSHIETEVWPCETAASQVPFSEK